MDKIVIQGNKSLKGEVSISGSKNSALPCLFATLLTDEECILNNVPNLIDIDTTCSLLNTLGKNVVRKEHTVIVKPSKTLKAEAPYELVRKMRASALVLGPLLARLGQAQASLPGGCAIGLRPIDIHLSGFEALGAECNLVSGMVQLKAKKLMGRRFRLKFPSVGATENLLMASTLAKGQTILVNVAREPEITDCAEMLQKMGAKIRGVGSSKLTIDGMDRLKGVEHDVIPDRIETSTYLIAAAITNGDLSLRNSNPEHVDSILKALKKAGALIEITKENEKSSYSIIRCKSPKSGLRSVSVVTGPYPKFPTDAQAQWMALMTLAKGKSTIVENIFESRHLHAAELCRMGANIERKGNRFLIEGLRQLQGANVMVSDLRAGAALVLAALAAHGETIIHRIYHLDRGYEDLELKLQGCGAQIRRVS